MESALKILFLTQWCQPEPAFKAVPFAKALQARGHDVEILTGFPNYPGGKLYPGYRIRFHQEEVIEGIPVHRVPLFPSHDRSGLKRALNYLSFLLSATLLGTLRVRKPDLVYVHNLVTLAPAAFLLRARYGCPIVMDIQDLWPDSVSDSKMIRNQLLMRFLDRFCSAMYKRASHLVTLSPGIKRELTRRGVPADRMSVIYNWCQENHIRPVAKNVQLVESLGLSGKFVVMYAGAMGVMQGLSSVIESARLIALNRPDIRFVFVGAGVEEVALRRAAEKLSNVVFLGLKPRDDMAVYLSIADVLLVHLKDTPLFRITIPSKTQAYMCAGKPLLMGVLGDAANIVTSANAGVVVEPENPEAIADGILEIAKLTAGDRKRLGSNGREFYLENMSMSAGVARFERLFATLRTGNSTVY